MQILCYKDSLEIITYTRGKWDTPGEYTNPLFACIQIDCADDEQPVKVDTLGDPTPIDIKGDSGEVYISASVEFEPVPQPEGVA